MVRLVLSKKERKLRRQQRREASRLHTLADLEGSYTAGVLGFVATLSPVRPWVSCECSDFGDLEELLADEEAAGAGRGGLKGALSKHRAVQQARLGQDTGGVAQEPSCDTRPPSFLVLMSFCPLPV